MPMETASSSLSPIATLLIPTPNFVEELGGGCMILTEKFGRVF